jgi:hypothetical protein
MNRLSILILVVFACGFICSAEKNVGIPTEEQVQKLAAAAWKESIKSIDVTFYKDYTIAPVPVEQLRKRAEEFADRELKGRSLDELKPYELERRNKIIEANFKNWVESQKFPRKIKKRVRVLGDNQRVDFVKVGPNEPLGPDTPFVHTFVNIKDANTGDFVNYHYAGDMNTVFIEKTKWTKETVIQFAGVPIASNLQTFLGIDQGGTLTSPNFVPDPNKIQELARTGFATTESIAGVKVKKRTVNKISIHADPNAPDARDIIEVGDPNHFPAAVLVCDKKDYSRTYHAEFRIPTTNQVILLRESGDFDSQGFPHNVTEIQYDTNGDLKEKSVYRIIKVELNPSIPAEVFEFRPPEGYKVVDQRPKKP